MSNSGHALPELRVSAIASIPARLRCICKNDCCGSRKTTIPFGRTAKQN